jgi:hypothetical protein
MTPRSDRIARWLMCISLVWMGGVKKQVFTRYAHAQPVRHWRCTQAARLVKARELSEHTTPSVIGSWG